MVKFELKLNNHSIGKINVYNLLIDGVDQFESFEEELHSNQKKGLDKIKSTITFYSGQQRLATGRRRKIDEKTGLWEFRADNIRAYH